MGASVDDHFRERNYVGLQEDENSDERSERDAVEKNVPEDVAFVAVPLGCGAGDNDALGVDHFAHHAAAAVGCTHQHGRNADLVRGDALKAAEQDVGSGVGTGECDAEPSEQSSEEGIEHPCGRER